jgi:hypothetical protein
MLAHPRTEASESLSYIAPVLRVSDISRSLAFYRDRLGFAVEFVYESFYAGVCRDGCHIHLKCSLPPPRDYLHHATKPHLSARSTSTSTSAFRVQRRSRSVLLLRALHSLSHCGTCRTGQSPTSAIQIDMSWVSLSPRRPPHDRHQLHSM